MKINERGYWENATAEGHEHDYNLAREITNFLDKEGAVGVYDVGCGDGFYTKFINLTTGYKIRCLGLDGNPHTPHLTAGYGFVLDLTEKANLSPQDWVLSLEVGEHIPPQYEQAFLENLDRLNKRGIILSWAIPGQGGDGHVNCKTNADVMQEMDKRGYLIDVTSTAKLRGACAEYPTPCYWFRDTLMVFRRVNDGLASS